MSHEVVESILAQIRGLPPEDRVALADEVDRLTWRGRAAVLIAGVRSRQADLGPMADEEIDRIVDEVRSETPLYERYWTRLRRSAL